MTNSHPARQHATFWVPHPVHSGGWREVFHEDPALRDFKMTVSVMRPWCTDSPTSWTASIEEQTTGLSISQSGFCLRYDAEAWCHYHVSAAWEHLPRFREMMHRQFCASTLQDGMHADERAVLVSEICLGARRLADRDRMDQSYWDDVEDQLTTSDDDDGEGG
jgi:hypothetical protein